MPSVKRSSSTKKRSNKRKRFTRRSSNSSSGTSFSGVAKNLFYDAIKTHGPTMLKFPFSYFCKQPLPDKFMTWLTTDVVGFLSSGAAASGSWGHAISQILFPWNVGGGPAAVIPNPTVNPNSINPAFLKNILYNSATGTGLYYSYRVWTVVCQYTFTPSAGGDAVLVAIAPVQFGGVFSNITQVGQATNSVMKVMTSGVAAELNSLVMNISIPAVFGISKKDYEAYAPATGTYAINPTSVLVNNVWYQTTDDGTTTNRIGVLQTMKMHVEFFGRVDTGALDN